MEKIVRYFSLRLLVLLSIVLFLIPSNTFAGCQECSTINGGDTCIFVVYNGFQECRIKRVCFPGVLDLCFEWCSQSSSCAF